MISSYWTSNLIKFCLFKKNDLNWRVGPKDVIKIIHAFIIWTFPRHKFFTKEYASEYGSGQNIHYNYLPFNHLTDL